jgi:peroxiredoxin Q/BCP
MKDALIIDDNRSTADALFQMLGLLGIHARVAYGSSAALGALAGFTPGVILLDITMPGIDGIEVLGFLRREPRLAGVPVVVITLDDQPETRERALKGGANAIIIKPATLDTLEEQLGNLGVFSGATKAPMPAPEHRSGPFPSKAKRSGPARPAHAAVPIKAGLMAPDFSLPDDAGVPRRLSDFLGRPVILYFYPADDTQGCTREACGFRDDHPLYLGGGSTVLGVSPDTVQSHRKFKAKYSLPFLLLADTDHKVCSLYGVWGRKQFMGRTYEGVLRTTFIIDRSGRIARVFEKVRPAEHSAEVLATLKAL